MTRDPYREFYEGFENVNFPPMQEIDDLVRSSVNFEWDANYGFIVQLPNDDAIDMYGLTSLYDETGDPNDVEWYYDPEYM